jgi:acyl-CoA synthetase (AMP-forming)/AMP-acid ligase II
VVPSEVEGVLHQHPAVAEAAAIERSDIDWGESVHAVVALKPGMAATSEEIIRFCARRLAGFEKPRSIDHVIQTPPRYPAGVTE